MIYYILGETLWIKPFIQCVHCKHCGNVGSASSLHDRFFRHGRSEITLVLKQANKFFLDT